MPRTRQLVTYPNREFYALILRVLSEDKPFLVQCSVTQAASTRGTIYAWRRACELAPDQAAAFGIDAYRLREVAFRIKPDGLEGVPANQLQTASLILSALGMVAFPPESSPAQKALETLREMGFQPEQSGEK